MVKIRGEITLTRNSSWTGVQPEQQRQSQDRRTDHGCPVVTMICRDLRERGGLSAKTAPNTFIYNFINRRKYIVFKNNNYYLIIILFGLQSLGFACQNVSLERFGPFSARIVHDVPATLTRGAVKFWTGSMTIMPTIAPPAKSGTYNNRYADESKISHGATGGGSRRISRAQAERSLPLTCDYHDRRAT